MSVSSRPNHIYLVMDAGTAARDIQAAMNAARADLPTSLKILVPLFESAWLIRAIVRAAQVKARYCHRTFRSVPATSMVYPWSRPPAARREVK
jgi:hypothetical protein